MTVGTLTSAQWRALPPLERIMRRVDTSAGPEGCWPWVGFCDRQGYGRVGVNGVRGVPVIRALYELVVGPIPDGMELDHRCHTDDPMCPGGPSCAHRRCVNPAHMEPVTGRENLHRARGPAAANAVKTHCAQGHEFTPENTRICRRTGSGRPFRQCRTCSAKWKRAYQERVA